MQQDIQFCYSAPVIRIIKVSVGKSILDSSNQIQGSKEDDYGEF